jgi:hypothetical protein
MRKDNTGASNALAVVQSPEPQKKRGLSINEHEEGAGNHGRSAGVGLWGFGSMVAITMSWNANHSILWMIERGIRRWFYVISTPICGSAGSAFRALGVQP